MKYKGRKLSGPRVMIVPILRSEEEGGNIFFQVQGVVDIEPFQILCPYPVAPVLKLPGNASKPDVQNKAFQSEVERWWKKRSSWIAIQALVLSDIEWESVCLTDPDTFENWSKELRDSGFSNAEFERIMTAILEVNGMSETMVEEARKSFLTIQAEQGKESNSLTAAATNTQSGVPVEKSVSSLQDSKT